MIAAYHPPKKIEIKPSLAKWTIQSKDSVLILFGTSSLEQESEHAHQAHHLTSLAKKAKALAIPTLDIQAAQSSHRIAQIGEYVAENKQIIVAGSITAPTRQLLQHISFITTTICIVDDAVVLESKTQHIQWLDRSTELGLHHMNTSTMLRMWELSAPSDFILSEKGILLSLEEHLELDVLQIDPDLDLRHYGLDSVAMVSLIGLWRANGAQIDYETFSTSCTLSKLFEILIFTSNQDSVRH